MITGRVGKFERVVGPCGKPTARFLPRDLGAEPILVTVDECRRRIGMFDGADDPELSRAIKKLEKVRWCMGEGWR